MSALPDMLAGLADLEIHMNNRARRRDREARKSPFNLPAGRVRDLVSFLGFTCGERASRRRRRARGLLHPRPRSALAEVLPAVTHLRPF